MYFLKQQLNGGNVSVLMMTHAATTLPYTLNTALLTIFGNAVEQSVVKYVIKE
jgi:hypothetical protein